MELIDRDALEVVTAKVPKSMDAKSYMAGMEYVLGRIDAMPTIEERKTGKWIKDSLCTVIGGSYTVRRCSLCESYYHDVVFTWNYCPNCGARMVQEGEDNGQTD